MKSVKREMHIARESSSRENIAFIFTKDIYFRFLHLQEIN